MPRSSPVQESVLQTIAYRLANTGQVLQSWCEAVEQGEGVAPGLAERLSQAALQIEQACEALTSGKTAAITEELRRHAGAQDEALGLRGRSEMINLVDFVGFVSTLGRAGVLRVQTRGEDFVLQLDQGAIVHVQGTRPAPGTSVGELLVSHGAAEAGAVRDALARGVADEHLAQTLLREDRVAERELRKALTAHAVQVVCRMHLVGSGFQFQFEEGGQAVERSALRLGVAQLLLESARVKDELERAQAERPPAPLPAGRSDGVAGGPPPGLAGPHPLLERFRSVLEQRVDGGAVDLPALPSSTGHLLALCAAGDDADHDAVAEVVRNDQALSAHVLRVANSAAYAPVEEITSVPLAVARLGLDTLRELAYSLTLKQRVFLVPGWDELILSLWKSAAIAGGFSRELCRELAPDLADGTLVGLLADVGKPIVLQALLDIADELGQELPHAVAEELMDRYHAPLGCLLVREWGLPEFVETVCLHHVDYSAALTHRREAKIAHLSRVLARWAQDPSRADLEALAALPVCADLGLTRAQLEHRLAARDALVEQAEIYS